MSDRIPTYLWLEAKMRELSAQGVGVYVVNRGDNAGGLVLLKISDMAGQCRVLTQQRNLDGDLLWMAALKEEVVDEKSANEYIARACNRDPDLWVIEVEDRNMKNPFNG
jgi:hypothetical protein